MQNVLDLLAQKGIAARRASTTKGGEWHSPCPGCGGDDRFHVWPEQNNGKGSYWCRSCGKKGDNIQFLRDFEGLSFPEACRRLDVDLPEKVPFRTPHVRSESRGAAAGGWQPVSGGEPAALWQEKARKLVDWAHAKLLENKSQMRWLQERGILKKLVEQYKLGWIPEDIWRPRSSWGLPEEIKKDGKKRKLWLPAGLVIPWMDGEKVKRVRIRRVQGEPRYPIISGSNMDCMIAGKAGRLAVVVESELDMILLDRFIGDMAAIVALGNSSRKPDARATAILEKSIVILLALDSDMGGIGQLKWWQEQFEQSKYWPVPDKKDPGDAYKAGVDLRAWVIAGCPKGWHVPASLLGAAAPESSALSEERSQSQQIENPKIQQLAAMLKDTPVFIQNLANLISLHAPQRWIDYHWAQYKQISELIYFNPEVFAYIRQHRDKRIDAVNIIEVN